MNLFRRGLLVAVLLSFAAALASPSAQADPIGRPWIAIPRITYDVGFGPSACDYWLIGDVDGTSIDRLRSSTSCSGAFSPGTFLLPWAVTWNPMNTGGTYSMRIQISLFGTPCLYAGSVTFTGAMVPTGTSTLSRVSGSGLCPATMTVS
jgi:hypothetical protein